MSIHTHIPLPPDFPVYLNIDISCAEPELVDSLFPIGKDIQFQVVSRDIRPWGQHMRLKMIQDDPDDWYAEQVKLMSERAPA